MTNKFLSVLNTPISSGKKKSIMGNGSIAEANIRESQTRDLEQFSLVSS